MSTPPNIFIHRSGQQYGPYNLEQVNNYLLSGTLLPTDLAWDGQFPDWIPLEKFPGVTAVASLPPSALPPPTRERNLALLFLMGFVWWIIFFFLSLFLGGAVLGGVAGVLHPGNGAEAGREIGRWFGQVFGLPLFLGTLGLSIWLTVIGKLPGTRKRP